MKDAELERILKPLANRRRIAILRYIKKKREASVGDIAEEIRLSFRSTSKHLGVLAAAGLIEREQRSLQMFYSIALDIPAVAKSILSLV